MMMYDVTRGKQRRKKEKEKGRGSEREKESLDSALGL